MQDIQDRGAKVLGKRLRAISKLPKTRFRKVQHNVTNEDFGSMVPDRKRLMIVGCTGAGKSTLLNRLAGCHHLCKESGDGKITFECDTKGVFQAGCGTQGVTSNTSFANLNYLGNGDRPLICIDTPGHDDPGGIGLGDDSSKGAKARETINCHTGDMYRKVKKMGFINCILVLHNDVASNRLNPATYEVLQKIDQMFIESDGNVWNHVIVAYSKCDADAKGWRANFGGKVKDMQAELKRCFKQCKGTDVPIIPLSGVEFRDQKSDLDSFEKLYELLESKPNLSTEKLQKFDGLTAQIEEIIAEKEFFQRQAQARGSFIQTAIATLVFLVCFFGMVHPWINVHSTFVDEAAYFGIFVYCMGMLKFYDFLVIAWDDYALSFLVAKGVIEGATADRTRITRGAMQKKED